MLLGSKNDLHNNYQDFQAFLDAGGKIGLQHDPLLYGAYLLNPFLVRVDLVPMLVVNQGEVAVIKGFVGLPTLDTSGAEFKFGSIVRPGHRGIWQEPLRTGKYPINPRVYDAEIVPTFILTLNWADATSEAHDLDAQLSSIVGKSREGFVFQIDLQVQIHVPDTRAPKVISMVGTMRNLVSEVLQSAVGNHFRNTLQALEAVKFIETRQRGAGGGVRGDHRVTSCSTRWRPRASTSRTSCSRRSSCVVLTQREIANQEKATFEEQQRAQTSRIEMEKAKGTADMQAQLASAQVGVQIKAERGRGARGRRRGRGRVRGAHRSGRGHEGPGDRPRRGEGDRGARARARDRVRGADRGARAVRRPRSSRSPTRWPRATSRWSPKCSSPAVAVGAPRRPRGDADALPVERWWARRRRRQRGRRPGRRRPGGDGNGASGGSGGAGGAASAAIDRPEGPETVPQVVREPSRDVDETPIKE